jgi:hypothetical protein
MGRGLGKVQRKVLAALRKHGPLAAGNIAAVVYFGSYLASDGHWGDLKRWHYVSVCRAIHSLEQQGLIRRLDCEPIGLRGVIRWGLAGRKPHLNAAPPAEAEHG